MLRLMRQVDPPHIEGFFRAQEKQIEPAMLTCIVFLSNFCPKAIWLIVKVATEDESHRNLLLKNMYEAEVQFIGLSSSGNLV